MALFSSNKSNVTNETTNTLTDQSANAGGLGSVAIGSGANVNIQDVSEKVAVAALDANRAATSYALGSNEAVSKAAMNETAATARAAIDNSTKQTQFVTNTILGLTEAAGRESRDARDSADTAIKSANSLISALQAQTGSALERAQAPEAASIKAILTPILLTVAAVAVAFFVFAGGRSPSLKRKTSDA